jgi:phenylacetate-CoA ligase
MGKNGGDMIEFAFSDFFSPGRLLYWRRLLWRSQYWPADRLEAFTEKLLQRSLDHCLRHVPYYRERAGAKLGALSAQGPRQVLAQFPVINKFDVMDHFEEFKADHFRSYRPKRILTTGTTGTPMHLYWDLPANIIELMSQYRHFSWAGYRLGDAFLDIRSVTFAAPTWHRWNWKCRSLEISSDDVHAGNIEKYAELLRRYRVRLWRGYPESLDYFARLLDAAGIDDVKPRAVISIAVNILEYQRRCIEAWSGVPLLDNYGLDEHIALVCQCPQGGYHVASEYGWLEIIKDDGCPAQAGEEGRIVATGFHNRAFPLLRYDTMDYAVASDRACACGRSLPTIEKLTGRHADFVLAANGQWLSASSWPFYAASEVRKSQLIQEERGAIDLYIVPEKNYTPAVSAVLVREFKKKLGAAMAVRIHLVREVPYPRPGKKYRFAICKLKHPYYQPGRASVRCRKNGAPN